MRKPFIYSLPLLIIFALGTFLLVKGAVRMVATERESSRRAEALKEEFAAETTRKSILERSIARLETQEGVEEEIKEKFGVVREGEHVAIIVDDRRQASSTDDYGIPWYAKLWHAIIR